MRVDQLDSIIKKSKNILLLSHINPDGDTLGSMCAMYLLIKENYKKEPAMAAVSKIPSTYLFLPGIEKVTDISDMDLSREYDLVINLDIAALDRCANAQVLFNKAKYTVNIDHHETNIGYANLNIVEPKASATGEVLFDIAKNMEWKISQNCAICLYTAILTDTGSFRFANTTPKTMQYAGELISYGIDNSDIYQKCYESNSKDMVLFQSYSISKAKFLNDNKIAYTIVYKKDLEKFNCNGEDFTDGLTEKLRAIKTTEIAFVVKELNHNMSKVSMRSRSFDIAQVCKAFGGGGHKLAAGAVIKTDVKNAVKQIIEVINKLGL